MTAVRQPVACNGVTDLLFPPEEEEELSGFHRAPEFCFACPERRPCAEAGWNEKSGDWGGLTLLDRIRAKKEGKTLNEIL